MSRSAREGRGGRRTWVVLACVAVAACSDSESGGNTAGTGPGPSVPDVRDAAGGAAGSGATDDAHDERETSDASGIADHAAGDVSADKSGAGDASSERSLEDAGSSDAESGGPALSDVGACVATVVTPRRLTPALYLMIDNTTSMDTIDMQQAMSRWNALIAAMPIFVDDPANVGLLVGLDFFPEAGPDGGTSLCNVSDYSTPQVPIGLLGGPSTPQGTAIAGAVRARARAGTSPTVPAL